MAMELISAAFQVFRAVTVATMERSTTLATTDSGGVLRSSIQAMPGAASCFTAMALLTGATAIRQMGCLFVALGINLFDSFDNLIIF